MRDEPPEYGRTEKDSRNDLPDDGGLSDSAGERAKGTRGSDDDRQVEEEKSRVSVRKASDALAIPGRRYGL